MLVRFNLRRQKFKIACRSLMLGLSFLSFQRLRFFVCSVALGLPCEGTRDAFDVPSNKQKFLNEIARNHYTTTQNKPLIISEGYHDNFRHQNRFKSLGCIWMIDQNRNFSNLDGIESGGLSAQCLVVDQDPLTETLSLVSCMRDQKLIWTGAIAFKVYCIEKIETMSLYFVLDMLNVKSFLKERIIATDYQLCSHSK